MRRIAIALSLLLASAGAPAAAPDATPPPAPQAAAPAGLVLARVDGSGPVLDPARFAGATPIRVAMLPQVIATPRHAAPSVAAIDVRGVRNDDHAAFLIEWEDPTADWRTGVDRFGDMVALQLPLAPSGAVAPFMGNVGGRVQILQWRADWQSDLERGPLAVKELYPNAYAADFHHEDHLPDAAAQPYRGAAGLGNPMAARRRESAVQDLVAEGYGSLTPRPVQAAAGRGVHEGGRWRVVITRPLAARGDAAARLEPGATQIAFAVWNGSAGEVGARKAWASWVPLEVPR